MEVSILKMPEDAARWHLVVDFMHMRKQVFVDDLDWQLHHDNDLEFEQYDDPATAYIVAHENAQVLGGARLVRTDRRFGIYSYMIRDAHLKNLPGLPEDLCEDEPPVSQSIWELTRFMSLNNLRVGEAILRNADRWLKEQGANTCLFLGPPAFMRMAKRMGYCPRPMGKIVGNRDGRFLAFSCAVS